MNHFEFQKTDNSQKQVWIDPVLHELWEVKRAINQEAQFDVHEIARLANSHRLENFAPLKQAQT